MREKSPFALVYIKLISEDEWKIGVVGCAAGFNNLRPAPQSLVYFYTNRKDKRHGSTIRIPRLWLSLGS